MPSEVHQGIANVYSESDASDGEERESDHLKARLGEMLPRTELLEQKIALLEGNGSPLARRRSRR